jgi:fructokinase
MSTLEYYGKTNIGSRPSKRGAGNELRFEDLRAIPFVGSWAQLKQNVPGFFGFGFAMQQLKAQGVSISFDPNYRNLMDERYTPTLQAMAALADVIKVSDDDLRGLFPGTEPEQALTQLRAMNPSAYYLLTRGGGGASLLLGDARSDAGAPKVAVVDTVGAGDASAAGLLHSLSNHPERPLQSHLHAALAAGSAACLQAGATPPPLAAMQRLFDQLQGDLT